MIQLRDYQERISTSAATLLREKKICYLSMECRTGKSLTALAAADKLGVKSVLFITKIKAKKSVEDDYRALNPNYELEVINYESVHKCVGKYDLVVCDEAHSLGAYPKPSQRAKAVKKVAKGKPVLYLSGTPSPESYSQLYHQFWICDYSPFAAYTTFYKWANDFVLKRQRMVNGYMINDYSTADKHKIDELTATIFVSFSQEDAGFSTNIVEHTLTVPMKQETAIYFRQLQKDFFKRFVFACTFKLFKSAVKENIAFFDNNDTVTKFFRHFKNVRGKKYGIACFCVFTHHLFEFKGGFGVKSHHWLVKYPYRRIVHKGGYHHDFLTHTMRIAHYLRGKSLTEFKSFCKFLYSCLSFFGRHMVNIAYQIEKFRAFQS